MKREVKDDLINKLLNQQTIVQNSDKEVDFRRAEVTAQLVKMILEVENAPETLELITGGLDEAKGEDVTAVSVVSVEEKKVEQVFVSNGKESKIIEANFESLKPVSKAKTFREKVIEAISEKGHSMTSGEIKDAIGFCGTDSNLSVQINNIQKHISKFLNPNNKKGSRGKYLYGLKEWREPFPSKKEEKTKEKKQAVTKRHLQTGRKTNDSLVYRVEANNPANRLTVTVGDKVKFRNVLGTHVDGVIVAMNIPGRESYKGEVHTCKTVTIEEDGSLYDRRLDQIIKSSN
jgi:hypothetical protein